MKKTTLLLILIGVASIVHAQTLYLDKVTVEAGSEIESINEYHYDENMQLQAIHSIYSGGDTLLTKLFENDRLVMEIYPGYQIKFVHFTDTVYEYRKMPGGEFEFFQYYLLNSAYQATQSFIVDQFGQPSPAETYQWNNGNCTKTILFSSVVESFSYNTNVKNPLFNENKYFRRRYPGSEDQLIFADFYPIQFNYTILSTEYGYPTKILFSPTLGDDRTFVYEYHEPSAIQDWSIPENYKILEVQYYNYMGQQITRPTEGHYIERLVTDRGVITFKRFAN